MIIKKKIILKYNKIAIRIKIIYNKKKQKIFIRNNVFNLKQHLKHKKILKLEIKFKKLF